MKKIIACFYILITFGLAAELPIVPSTEIVVEKGKWATISFPFDLQDVRNSPFIGKTSIPDDVSADEVVNSEVLLDSDALPQPKGQAQTSIKMEKTKRTISIYPYRLGTTQLVIYGNKSYPMHLKINVANKAGADHFTFVGYTEDVQKKTQSFEMVTHEKVISKLIKYGYNNKVPSGYRKISGGKTYTRDGMNFKLNSVLKGDGYQLDTWIVKNTKGGIVSLYPEMFYVDGIYAVAFENNKLNTGEATKMFVVKKNS